MTIARTEPFVVHFASTNFLILLAHKENRCLHENLHPAQAKVRQLHHNKSNNALVRAGIKKRFDLCADSNSKLRFKFLN